MSAITFGSGGFRETIENPTPHDWKVVLIDGNFLLIDYIEWSENNGQRVDIEIMKDTLKYFNGHDDRNYKSLKGTPWADNQELIDIVAESMPPKDLLAIVDPDKVLDIAIALVAKGWSLNHLTGIQFKGKDLNDFEEVVIPALEIIASSFSDVSERLKGDRKIALLAVRKVRTRYKELSLELKKDPEILYQLISGFAGLEEIEQLNLQNDQNFCKEIARFVRREEASKQRILVNHLKSLIDIEAIWDGRESVPMQPDAPPQAPQTTPQPVAKPVSTPAQASSVAQAKASSNKAQQKAPAPQPQVSTPAQMASAPAKAPASKVQQQAPPEQLAATPRKPAQTTQMSAPDRASRRSNAKERQQAPEQLQPHIPRSQNQTPPQDDEEESDQSKSEPRGLVSSCISYLTGCWNSIFSWLCSCFNS